MYTTLAFLALLGAPYIYEIISLRVNKVAKPVRCPQLRAIRYPKLDESISVPCYETIRSLHCGLFIDAVSGIERHAITVYRKVRYVEGRSRNKMRDCFGVSLHGLRKTTST